MPIIHARTATGETVEVIANEDGELTVEPAARLAGADATLDVQHVLDVAQVAQITADTGVKTGSGYLLGFVCIATTSGTFVVYDNTTNSGTIIYPLTTPTVGQIITLPAARPFSTGLYIDVTNTLTLDVYYRAAV